MAQTVIWPVMWVSQSLCSAVNRKHISGILSSDWMRGGLGSRKMSFSVYSRAEDPCYVYISDARLNVELFNSYLKFWEKKLNTTSSTLNFKKNVQIAESPNGNNTMLVKVDSTNATNKNQSTCH